MPVHKVRSGPELGNERNRRSPAGGVGPGRGVSVSCWSVSPVRSPNRTCSFHRIRLSTSPVGLCRGDRVPSVPRCWDLRAPVAVAGDRDCAGVEEVNAVLAELPSVMEVAAAQGLPVDPRVFAADPSNDPSPRVVVEVPSMGSIDDRYDNGQMESFWARMQVELLNRNAGTPDSSWPMPSSSTLRTSTTGNQGTHRLGRSTRSSTSSATPTPPPAIKQADRAKPGAHKSGHRSRGDSVRTDLGTRLDRQIGRAHV